MGADTHPSAPPTDGPGVSTPSDLIVNGRVLAGLSQAQLANRAGFAPGRVRRLEEDGEASLGDDHFRLIEAVLRQLLHTSGFGDGAEPSDARGLMETARLYKQLNVDQRTALRAFLRKMVG